MSNSLLEDVDQHVERLRSLQGRMPDGQRQQLQRQLTTFKIQLELVKQLSATQEELLKASTATGSRNGGPGSKTGPHAHHVAAHGAKTRTNGAQAAGTNGMQRPSNGLKRSASGLDGEDLLTGVFGVADTLAPDELHALAAQASVSPLQCRTMFERLRSGVRSYLQRMHSRMARSALAGAHAKLHGGAAVTQAGGEGGDQKAPQQKSVADEAGSRRERELARLNPVLDAQGGVDTQRTGSAGFALLMKEASSYEVREAQLRALAATPAAGLKVLVGSELLTSLNGWLQEGDADGQHTFNRSVLVAIQKLPLTWPLLDSSQLLLTVARLHKSRHARTQAAASALLSHLTSQFPQLMQASVVQRAVTAGPSTGKYVPPRNPAATNQRRSRVQGRAHSSAAAADRPLKTVDRAQRAADKAAAEKGDGVPASGKGVSGSSTGAGAGPSSKAPAPSSLPFDPVEEKGAAMAIPLGHKAGQAGMRKPATKPPAPSTAGAKPLSADDIRKARQKAAAQAAYQQQLDKARAGAGSTGAGTGAQPASGALPLPPAKRQAVGESQPQPARAHEQQGMPPPEQLIGLSPEEQAIVIADHQKRQRQAAALQQVSQLTSNRGLQQEMVGAMMVHEDKAAKLQAARKQAQERAAAEAERVAQQLRSLGPTTQFSTPPFLHPMLYEHLQLGSESQEVPRLELRARALPQRSGPAGDTPAEPADRAAANPPPHSPPQVPWMPTAEDELGTQNKSLWDTGLRLPAFVRPPRGALAGQVPPPPPPVRPFVPYKPPPPAQPQQPAPAMGPAATGFYAQAPGMFQQEGPLQQHPSYGSQQPQQQFMQQQPQQQVMQHQQQAMQHQPPSRQASQLTAHSSLQHQVSLPPSRRPSDQSQQQQQQVSQGNMQFLQLPPQQEGQAPQFIQIQGQHLFVQQPQQQQQFQVIHVAQPQQMQVQPQLMQPQMPHMQPQQQTLGLMIAGQAPLPAPGPMMAAPGAMMQVHQGQQPIFLHAPAHGQQPVVMQNAPMMLQQPVEQQQPYYAPQQGGYGHPF